MSRVKWERVMLGAQVLMIAMLVVACGLNASPSPSVSIGSSQPAVIPLPTKLADVIPFDQALPLFEYDRQVPFEVSEVAEYPRGTAALDDIAYAGANGVRMPAYIVRPTGKGPFAGVIWMGWTGDYSQIRKEFVDEAFSLADHGVVSLLVSGYFPWYVTPLDKDADRLAVIGQIRELRRAIDVLSAQPGVDASRIAFVGHSMGGMFGLDLAAVDHRVKAAVLMAPHATFTDWVFQGYGLEPALKADYRAAMASFDPITFAPHAGPTTLYFQFGSDDPYVPNDTARSLYGSASLPKTIGWYAGGHDLDGTATTDRDSWLATQLRLSN